MLGLALIMAMLMTAIPAAFANGNGGREPGYSPGYWKHQCKAWVTGRGRPHYTYAQLTEWANDFGYTVEIAYDEFTTGNNADGAWTDLANLFNDAAGLDPYEE